MLKHANRPKAVQTLTFGRQLQPHILLILVILRFAFCGSRIDMSAATLDGLDTRQREPRYVFSCSSRVEEGGSWSETQLRLPCFSVMDH